MNHGKPATAGLLASCLLFVLLSRSAWSVDKAEIAQLLQQGQHQQALAQINDALNNNDNDVSLQVLQADAIAAAGNTEQAIKLYRQLIKQHPQQAELYNNLAILLSNKGDYEAARDQLNAGLRTNNTYATIYENLSSIYLEMARDSYGKALQIGTKLQPLPLKKLAVEDEKPLVVALTTEQQQKPAAEDEKPLVVAETTEQQQKPAVEDEKPLVVAETTEQQQKPAAEDEKPLDVEVTTEQQQKPAVEDEKPLVVAETAQQQTADSNQLENIVTLNSATDKKVTAEAVEVSSRQQDVIDSLEAWAAAWSAQAVDLYLSFYHQDYNPPRISRSSWEEQRRARLKRPEWIQIQLDDIKVEMTGEKAARVTLVQSYKSNSYQDKTRKQVSLAETSNGWRILKERSLGIVQ